MLTPFDALIDAIIQYSGYRVPGSAVHKARNPGGLKAHGEAKARDPENYRVFKTDIDGLQALKFDVRLKISGRAKAKCVTVAELAEAYRQPVTAAKAWVTFIRQALNDQTISVKSPLTFFVEKQ
jgi:hypothetical protein